MDIFIHNCAAAAVELPSPILLEQFAMERSVAGYISFVCVMKVLVVLELVAFLLIIEYHEQHRPRWNMMC